MLLYTIAVQLVYTIALPHNIITTFAGRAVYEWINMNMNLLGYT